MEVTTSHELFYDIKAHVPINEVSASLIGLEGILDRVPAFLEEIYPDIDVQIVKIYIDEIKAGSLSERFLVEFFFGSQEDFDQKIRDLREKFGMDNPKFTRYIVGVAVLALLSSGCWSAYNLIKPKTVPKHIEINNNTIINIAAEATQLTTEEIKEIIHNVTKDEVEFAKDASRIILPAKNAKNGSIIIDNERKAIITHLAIQETPTVELEHLKEFEDEFTEYYENVDIIIRATDKDKNKSGWRVFVPDIDKKMRLNMHIAPGINKETLSHLDIVKGDISAVYKRKPGKEPKLLLVFLMKINN